jgi:hypothetical protein
MKKAFRALLLSSLSLILLTTASIGLSLAWYVSARNLQIQDFDLEMRTERNLTISADGEHFHEALSDKDIPGYDHVLSAFTPVTSAQEVEGEDWYGNAFDARDPEALPLFYGPYSTAALPDGLPFPPDVATTGFFQQVFYLKADDDVLVSLDFEKSFARSDHERNVERSTKEVLSDSSVPEEEREAEIARRAQARDEVLKSLRLSFLDRSKDHYSYTLVAPGREEGEKTLFGGPLDIDNTGYYNTALFPDGTRREIFYGAVKNREKIVYGEKTSSIPVEPGESGDIFVARHSPSTYPVEVAESLENGLEVEEEDALSWKEFTAQGLSFHLKKDTAFPFVLSLYIEGWDVSSVNATMFSSFQAVLSFRIVREE